MRKLASFAVFILFLATSGLAANRPLQSYAVLIIQKFTVDPELLHKGDFPPGYEDVLEKTLFARLLTEQTFPRVMEDADRSHLPNAVIMEGQITQFGKGNRAARVAVGYGAGAAKMKLVLTFRDANTGQEILKLEHTGRYAGFGNLTGGSAETARDESGRKVVEGLLKKIQAAR